LINYSNIIIALGILFFVVSLIYFIYHIYITYFGKVTKSSIWPTSRFGFVVSISLMFHFLLFVLMMRSDSDDLSLLVPQEKFGLSGETFVSVGIITEDGAPEVAPAPETPIEQKPAADDPILKTTRPDPTVPTATQDTKTPSAPSTTPSTQPNPTPSTTTSATGTANSTGTSATPGVGGQGAGEEKAIQIAEEMPIFPGCEDEMTALDREACTKRKMTEFIQKNVKYPDIAVKNNTQGKIMVTFVVEKDGSITNIKTIGTRLGDHCDEAAITSVNGLNNLTRRIQAGRQNGKTVRIRYTIPVNFSLKERGKN
jgi:periplasmic protein TonB